MRNSAWGSC